MTKVGQYIIFIIFLFSFAWMVIDQYFPNLRAYLISLWKFYITKELQDPIHYQLYGTLTKQLKSLEEAGKRKYEQKFVKMMLWHAGKFRIKMTGKHKNKKKWKVKRQGKKYSNYSH